MFTIPKWLVCGIVLPTLVQNPLNDVDMAIVNIFMQHGRYQ
jgi:hypothetical protein